MRCSIFNSYDWHCSLKEPIQIESPEHQRWLRIILTNIRIDPVTLNSGYSAWCIVFVNSVVDDNSQMFKEHIV